MWFKNADGEGRPGLTEISVAAHVLFEIFDSLPKSNWFTKPTPDLKKVLTCKQSGFLSTSYCDETKIEWIPKHSNTSIFCTYHKPIHTDNTDNYRVTGVCVSPLEIKINWFVLPPIREYYFKIKNPTYKSLPPFQIGCIPITENQWK